MNRSLLRLVLPTLLLVGGLAYCRNSRTLPAESPVAAAASTSAAAGDYTALLDGLKEGDTIGEWRVDKIYPEAAQNKTPQVAINLERKGSGVTVYVARKEAAALPPITTDKYAISYGHLRPFGEPIPPNSAEDLGARIADRVRRTENKVQVPTGL